MPAHAPSVRQVATGDFIRTHRKKGSLSRLYGGFGYEPGWAEISVRFAGNLLFTPND